MKLRTQLVLGYLVVFLLMIVIAGIMYRSTSVLIENQRKVDLLHSKGNNGRLLLRLLIDMETGVRGYALTGNEAMLEPYEIGVKQYPGIIMDLSNKLKGVPEQLARLQEIETAAMRWRKEIAEPMVNMRKDLGHKDYKLADYERITSLAEGRAKDKMDSLRGLVSRFINIEEERLDASEAGVKQETLNNLYIVIGVTIAAIILGSLAMFFATRSLMAQVGGEPAEIATITEEIARGNLSLEFNDSRGRMTGIRSAVWKMMLSLREANNAAKQEDWLKTGIAQLNVVMVGTSEVDELGSDIIGEMAKYSQAKVGAFYLLQDSPQTELILTGSYAYTERKNLSNTFKLGEGLVGQAALEKQQIIVKNVPEDYVRIISGTGEAVPSFICVTPFLHAGVVKGVVELGFLNEVDSLTMEYIKQAASLLAVVIENAKSRKDLSRLLAESQQLTEESQAQQEELQATNEELEQQTRRLLESEERLKAQQEELEVTNEELKEKNDLLDRQKRAVDAAQQDLEKKASELALASKYKSEFLANMSHELRTPLNSLLLLAQSLSTNSEGNLNKEQIESAQIIYSSGSDLLNLINEILDLSKIEAGKMDLKLDTIHISEIDASLRGSFTHMADARGIGFSVEISPDVPEKIISDRKRFEQIMRNLISNAIKFTEEGAVTVRFINPDDDVDLSQSGLTSRNCMAVEVCDTGIGIAPEQQALIFEAFHQGDGSTARKYGGTGLGLSISRELSSLLGGELQLRSTLGEGATFILYLPLELRDETQIHSRNDWGRRPESQKPVTVNSGVSHDSCPVQVEDDRSSISDKDKSILIIEDDPHFSVILREKCHSKGFKCLCTPRGESGLELAVEFRPTAIILDIRLPGIDGWSVLNELKENVNTRHIPVHIVSVEESSVKALNRGAVGHAVKPLDQEHLEDIFQKLEKTTGGRQRNVLVVEDNAQTRANTVNLISSDMTTVDEVENGAEAIEALRSKHYDCMVLDLSLPDIDGGALLKKISMEGMELPPVVVHTARELSSDEVADLREHADSIVIKDVRSQERLLDEVSLFLHRVVSDMPERERQIIRSLHDTDNLLRDKLVLIVDDDMRTTFAISSLLTKRGMKTLKAENGEKALKLLEENPGVDLILMDIMMPVMDGYETMNRIRAQEMFGDVPIIVLTAKAMSEDREKCLKVGANDYMPKPVNPDRLISMMRVWLYR